MENNTIPINDTIKKLIITDYVNDISISYQNLKEEEIKTKAKPLELIEEEYQFYYQKLKIATKAILAEQNIRTIDLIKKINETYLTPKGKMKTIISYGVLVQYFKELDNRTDEETLMLATSSTNLALEDYTFYIGVISNYEVSKAIIEKTSDLTQQKEIALIIMDEQQAFYEEDLTSQNYDFFVKNALAITNEYQASKVK